jgi:GTPase SAR1 family protein
MKKKAISLYLLGTSVGKTSLINRFINETFTQEQPTTELDIKTARCKGEDIKLYDEPEIIASASSTEMKEASVVLMVYDCTNR